MEIQIADVETEEPLGVGEDGEVWMRGPNIMKGYLNNKEATDATVTADGWLKSGDIGHVDPQNPKTPL
jgi:4-coumarate--CoA ligase